MSKKRTAVRIPAPILKSAKLKVGQRVELTAQDAELVVRAVGGVRLTLAQKLAVFDPARHGGEAMSAAPVGLEVA